MDAKLWVSRVKSDVSLGDKPGLRWKLFGGDWSPATHILGIPVNAYLELVQKNDQGFALDRAGFPEALAIWDRERFACLGDIFWANGFAVVKGRLAETLHRFDLGEGGLLPLRIFQEDLTTPEPGEFFFVNFGARKDSLVAEQSKALKKLYVDRSQAGAPGMVGFTWPGGWRYRAHVRGAGGSGPLERRTDTLKDLLERGAGYGHS